MGVLNDPTLLNHEILNYLLKKKITFIENIHYYIQKQTTVSIIAQVEINSSQTLPKTWGQILFLNDFFSFPNHICRDKLFGTTQLCYQQKWTKIKL